MHYMQNVNVRECVESGRFRQPYSLDRPLSFVDLADVGAVVATVLAAPREHRWATSNRVPPTSSPATMWPKLSPA
ncbi:hypothetical protein [Amycolatopsis methanolica]